MRECPWPSLPRCSASSKCSQSTPAWSASKPTACNRLSPSSRCTAPELQHGPAALGRDAAEGAIRVDRDGMPDRFEEGQVGVAVRVRRRGLEVVVELTQAPRLLLGVK